MMDRLRWRLALLALKVAVVVSHCGLWISLKLLECGVPPELAEKPALWSIRLMTGGRS